MASMADMSPHIQRADDDVVHDVVFVGFGPASLAIAIALHDALEIEHLDVPTDKPKVRFLERQQQFGWHKGMLLPGARMQISFIKDLATLRDPRSKFTFLNYLYCHRRLISFNNLGTFRPHRAEFEAYMRWCADHFDHVVDYGYTVNSISVHQRNPTSDVIQSFSISSVNTTTGEVAQIRTKKVVVAVGGTPKIPRPLQLHHPRIIHSSQYEIQLRYLFQNGDRPRVAVIGAGQSAAEIFIDIPRRLPGAQSILLIRGDALRPSDDSPFVNELFNPDRVETFFKSTLEDRAASLTLNQSTNYAVVRPDLLEEIYTELYSYQFTYKSEEDWPRKILKHRSVTGVSECPVGEKSALRVRIQNDSSGYTCCEASATETLDVDLVVVATGYDRMGHKSIMRELEYLSPGKDWAVDRDYRVQFQEGAVQDDAGIWLQGCNEATHGLSDSLLSILAVRGGRLVQKMFGTQDVRREAGKKRTAASS